MAVIAYFIVDTDGTGGIALDSPSAGTYGSRDCTIVLSAIDSTHASLRSPSPKKTPKPCRAIARKSLRLPLN